MAREFAATAYERATQMKPRFVFRIFGKPGWMAHTSVGPDTLA